MGYLAAEGVEVGLKQKIVLLPLDERPCNAAFPQKLFDGDSVHICVPDCLGRKKQPAKAEAILPFLQRECRDADGLIVSMDMLLYGGLVPSRLHTLDERTVMERMNWLCALKREFPKLMIYAFQCIMRCPSYSSSDEEPDYYEQYGSQIHESGKLKHQHLLGLCDAEQVQKAIDAIAPAALTDYLERRAFNLSFNQRVLELVRDGTIDFLVLPQDDSAPYGYTAIDQQKIREQIAQMNLQLRVHMYPGADEVALTLMSRMLLHLQGKRPRIFLKYAAHTAQNVIPTYEDRTLGESVKCHIAAAGCRLADAAAEADFVMAIDCPAGKMKEAVNQPAHNADYDVERSLTEFVEYISDCVHDGKPVTVCDNAYANGGDLELISLLNQADLLDQLAGYAGWNTSANTMGTAIAQGVYHFLLGDTAQSKDFLALRYMEDVGYCAVVRQFVTNHVLSGYGMDYFDVHEEQGAVSREVQRQLELFSQKHLTSICDHIQLQSVRMPWKRMFETDLSVRWMP